MPVFLLLSIIFAIWLGFEIKRHNKKETSHSQDFWKREYDANFVRPKDISSLQYLVIPLDMLPFQDTTNEALLEVQTAIRKLAEKKLLNLNGKSNTDLKYQYGAKHFEELALYDQNFLIYLRTLNKWAHLLYETDCKDDAKTILEYSIQLGSDISSTYKLLAEIYVAEGNYGKLDELTQRAQGLTTLLKPSILQMLLQYQNV
ncbi:MAG: hypothetical protein ACERKN_09475 [Velocimicrobium sp.]